MRSISCGVFVRLSIPVSRVTRIHELLSGLGKERLEGSGCPLQTGLFRTNEARKQLGPAKQTARMA
jgi:hypothetical protein